MSAEKGHQHPCDCKDIWESTRSTGRHFSGPGSRTAVSLKATFGGHKMFNTVIGYKGILTFKTVVYLQSSFNLTEFSKRVNYSCHKRVSICICQCCLRRVLVGLFAKSRKISLLGILLSEPVLAFASCDLILQ